MPHTRSKKKKAAAIAANGEKKVVHTKRQQIEDEEGWTHVVESSTRTRIVSEKEKWLVGDFQRDGVSYVTKTMEEMRKDLGFYTKLWEEDGACSQLKGKLLESIGRMKVEGVVCLGLGSLQSARREGRRASWTQLAALRTIMDILGMYGISAEIVSC